MYRNNRWFYVIDFIVIVLIFVCFISSKNVVIDSFSVVTDNYTLRSYLESDCLIKKIDEKNIVESKEENTIEENKEISEKVEEKPIEKENISKKSEPDGKTNEEKNNDNKTVENKINTTNDEKVEKKETTTVPKTEKVIEKLKGALAGYGPDCYGCTSYRTATGKYIGEGNIYYDDKEYGRVRIVAGDKSYPFGTIVKISNAYTGKDATIYAIVLDRGGGVGKGKKFLFDLLFESEKKASIAGSRQNVDFEILRLGY